MTVLRTSPTLVYHGMCNRCPKAIEAAHTRDLWETVCQSCRQTLVCDRIENGWRGAWMVKS